MTSATSATLPVSFNTAFERLRETVSKDDVRSFNSTRMEDVWTTARDIERHLESRRSLRGFHRIQPFLAGIEQYSKVVEVLCQGTPYLPYIWAPIKLLLQIAQGHISALEKLIDAYAMIGEAMPRFDRLSTAFRDDPEFQQVMGHFYEDILDFHRRAYMFFRRRSWMLVFDSLWKSFDLRFNGILENLRKHRDLIDQEANAISIAEAKTWRNVQLDQIRQGRAERVHDTDKKERERLASYTREAVAWFGAGEDQEDHYNKYSRACDATNGHWALNEPSIVSWMGQSRDNSVMWLNGKPGAGKSVICSKLIEHIQEKTKIVAIFYFFNHNQAFQKHATEVLRSFATQLLAASTDLAPYVLENFANNGQRATKRNLAIILEKMITSLQNIRIVVDGLDECPPDEQDEVIEDLLRIRGPVPGACKILLSSRKHRTISKFLQSKPTFRLDDKAENVNATIASFVQPRVQYLRNAFSSDIIDELGHQVLAKANGMFLWVKLIMFTLEDLHFESDVREAIEMLPEDLEAVYERILLRICGDGKTPNQRTAIRILQWMLVAQRPLKRCELESGIVLDERVSQITRAAKPRGDVLSLCHPLLDAEDDPGGCVSFIHFTAQEYLRKPDISPFFQLQRAQLIVSLSCVLYLPSSLEFFDPRVTHDEKRSNIAKGFHDLHLYANDHWLDHLRGLVDTSVGSRPGGPDLMTLRQALERLAVKHNELAAFRSWNIRDDSDLTLSPRENIWHPIQSSPAVRRLLDGLTAYRKHASVSDGLTAKSHPDSDQNSDPTLLSTIRTRYQSMVEEILGSEEVANKTLSDFKARHSSGAFLCRYTSCPRAAQGFNTSELRQKHEESHRPRFQCADVACGFFGFTFDTRAAMKRHTAQHHDEERTALIPDALARNPRHSHQNRPLFTLKEHYSMNVSPPPRNTLHAQPSVTPTEQNASIPAQLRGSQTKQGPSDALVTDVGNCLADLRLEDLSGDLKQEHEDWHVMYNPRAQRRISLELIYDASLDLGQGAFPSREVSSLCFSPNDKLITIATSLCFSPNDELIAIATPGKITIADLSSGAHFASLSAGLPDSVWISDVQFSPCGNFLAFCCTCGPLGIWDIARASIRTRFGGDNEKIIAVNYDSNGEHLVSVGWKKLVVIWSVKTGQVAFEFAIDIKNVLSVAFSSDDSMLAAGSSDGSIWIWVIGSGRVVSCVRKCHLDVVNAVAFDADSRRLVSGSRDRTVKVWDVPESSSSSVFALEMNALTLEGQKDGVDCIATLPHSTCILSDSKGGVFQLWDHNSGEAILRLKSHTSTDNDFGPSISLPLESRAVAASKSGELFATVGGDRNRRIRVWRISPYNQQRSDPAGIHSGPYLPSSQTEASSRKERVTPPKDVSSPSPRTPESTPDTQHLLINAGINPGNLSASQFASFAQQNPTTQRKFYEDYQRHHKQKSGETISSYWTVPEQEYFYNLLWHSGRNWRAIATMLKTKTPAMVKNFYNRKIQEGDSGKQLEEYGARADRLRAEGAGMGPLPTPTPVGAERHYAHVISDAAIVEEASKSPHEAKASLANLMN